MISLYVPDSIILVAYEILELELLARGRGLLVNRPRSDSESLVSVYFLFAQPSPGRRRCVTATCSYHARLAHACIYTAKSKNTKLQTDHKCEDLRAVYLSKVSVAR